MKRLLRTAALVVTLPLAASPWDDVVQRRRGTDPRTAKWMLCIRPQEFTSREAGQDPALLKLLAGGELGLEPLSAAVARDLWERKGWGPEAHWVLLSPFGDEAAEGAGRPRGEALLSAIHSTGVQARFELREGFLKEHPRHGEARLEALGQAFQILKVRLAGLEREGGLAGAKPELGQAGSTEQPGYGPSRISFPPASKAEAMADDLYAEVAEHLEALLALPDWQHEAGVLAAHLAFWDVGQSSRVRRLFEQAVQPLEQSLREDPADPEVLALWAEAVDASGQQVGSPGSLCIPLPGEVWPEPGLVARMLEPAQRRRDWAGVLRLLDELGEPPRPEPLSAHGWELHCRLLCALKAQRAVALAGQGSWEMAGAALADARHWGGSAGVREALLHRGILFTGPGGDARWRSLVVQTLGREGRLPVMPTVPQNGLRLVVSGSPSWIGAWSALRDARELLSWSPAELRWEAAGALAGAAEEGPRWMLCRGDELLASGRSCPTPAALATALAAAGPSLLQRLEAVLERNPEHLAARRYRFDLLERRMPDRRLEPILAEDAAKSLVPLPFDPQAAWKPDRALWGQAAARVLPQLEEALRSWPNRAHLWQSWISWARFHPSQPSVLDLVRSVDFWCPRGDWRGWLPYPVQRKVAAELRRQGEFQAMREWFGSIWEQLDRRPLAKAHRAERSWLLERRREEETSVYEPLRDALQALGATQERAELERTFAAMMGREAPRPRR